MQIIQFTLFIFTIFRLIAKQNEKRIPFLHPINVTLQLGQPFQFDNLKLQNVYRIEATQKTIYTQFEDSQICNITENKLKLMSSTKYLFLNRLAKNHEQTFIYQMQDIENLKNSLDIAYFNQKYYVIFSDGNIEVYTIQERSFIRQIVIKHSQQFNEGFFIQNKNKLLFINNQKLYLIQNYLITQITSYKQNKLLQSAKLYDNDLLIMAIGRDGIKIGSIIGDKYQEQLNIESNFFENNEIDISDIEYDLNSSLLFALDRNQGIKFINYNHIIKKIAINSSYSTFHKNCELIKLYNNVLYMTCPHLVKYNLTSQTKQIKQQIRIYPQYLFINPQQQPGILLLSDSHIGYYQNWNTQIIYYDLLQPQNLIFNPSSSEIIYINDYEIIQFKYQIQNETMICKTTAQNHVGTHHVNVYLKSNCNSTLLEQEDIYQEVNEGEICIYQINMFIEVQRYKNSIWIWILVCLGVIQGGSLLIFAVWYLKIRSKLKSQYEQLNQVTVVEMQAPNKNESFIKEN